MSKSEDGGSGIWRFVGGMLFGVILTAGYVKYAFELPAIFTLGDKIAEATIVTTAEIDLYDLNKPMDVRMRALSVVLGQQPDKIIELDQQFNHLLLNELYRRKAERQAKHLKHTYDAYDKVFEHEALVKTYERKFRTTDPDALKQCMLLDQLTKEDFLNAYLRENYPDVTAEKTLQLILGVYQHNFQNAGNSVQANGGKIAIQPNAGINRH